MSWKVLRKNVLESPGKVLKLEKILRFMEPCCQRTKALEIKIMEGLFSWAAFNAVIICRPYPSQSVDPAVAVAVCQFEISVCCLSHCTLCSALYPLY